VLDLVLKRSDTGQSLLNEDLLLEHDLDQFGFGKLLQLLACHGGDPWCGDEFDRVAWLFGPRLRRGVA